MRRDDLLASAIAGIPDWILTAETPCYPREISVRGNPGQNRAVDLARVLEVMVVDLGSLGQVFRGEPPESETNPYRRLGSCNADDTKAWRALAVLLQKKLVFFLKVGLGTRCIAEYYPDGKFKTY